MTEANSRSKTESLNANCNLIETLLFKTLSWGALRSINRIISCPLKRHCCLQVVIFCRLNRYDFLLIQLLTENVMQSSTMLICPLYQWAYFLCWPLPNSVKVFCLSSLRLCILLCNFIYHLLTCKSCIHFSSIYI